MQMRVNSLQRSNKTRMNNCLNCLAGLLTFLHYKDVKISLYIIVLIARGCFRPNAQCLLQGLNELFLHLMRALCFCIIMISCLVFFSCIFFIMVIELRGV